MRCQMVYGRNGDGVVLGCHVKFITNGEVMTAPTNIPGLQGLSSTFPNTTSLNIPLPSGFLAMFNRF